jgi:hypothetical protein
MVRRDGVCDERGSQVRRRPSTAGSILRFPALALAVTASLHLASFLRRTWLSNQATTRYRAVLLVQGPWQARTPAARSRRAVTARCCPRPSRPPRGHE